MHPEFDSFIKAFDWKNAGGSSFVELTTGINIAMAGWEQFKEKLNYPRTKCEEIINSITTTIKDSEHKNGISRLFLSVAQPIIALNMALWRFAFYGAIAAAAVGVAMLWSNLYFGHDWILILPSLVHLTLTSFTLLVFTWFARLVNWCCKVTNPNPKQVAEKIEEMLNDTARGVRTPSAITQPQQQQQSQDHQRVQPQEAAPSKISRPPPVEQPANSKPPRIRPKAKGPEDKRKK